MKRRRALDTRNTCTKEEARAAFRRAWVQRCLAQTPDGQMAAEILMEALELACIDAKASVNARIEEWDAFVSTVPYFRELWVDI